MSSTARRPKLSAVPPAPRPDPPGPTADPALATLLAAEVYLGPAEVVSLHGDEVEVELPEGGTARATLALAFPYEPAPGDTLLVIAKGGRTWVIGVIRGSGRSVLSFPGDVALRAEGGRLRVSGDLGVEIEGPEISLRGESLRVVAGAVVEKLRSLYQRVTGLASVHAAEAHTVVEGASVTQAKSAAIVTEETVTINGRQVHLG